MATIIVESGSGATITANSYVSIASASAYLESKGITTWSALTTTTQSTTLIEACYYMELLNYKGLKSLSTQPLEWPRRGVYDKNGYPVLSDEIPTPIKRGQMELAYRYSLDKDPVADLSVGDGYITMERVADIEVQYSEGYAPNVSFPEVDKILAPFLKSSLCVETERA
jgi:hypothetical protein